MPETCSFCRLSKQTERVEFKGTVVSVCSDCSELVLDSIPPGKVTVQPLGEKDLELVLAWRNNPRIFDQFREQDEPLEWNEHKEWFDSRPSDRYDYVIRYEDRRVGIVSIATDGDVSIYIGEIPLWGEGIASQILEWVCRKFGDRKSLRAQIREDNQRSQSLFESCGFDQIAQEDGWNLFEYSE